MEDEALMREALAELLGNAGYEVTATCTGDEAAILLAEDPRFDLLLTDVTMPGQIDGIGLAEHARELQPGLPVVFISGRADIVQRSGAIGAPVAVVRKPFAAPRLLDEIVRCLDRPAVSAPNTDAGV